MARKGSSSSARSSPYAAAATLLSQIIEEKKSFKKLVYSKDGKLRCTKTTYAQVCQVLSYKKILDQVLEEVPKLKKEVRNAGLLHVLVYELLFGPNQKINGGGAVKRKIVQHEKQLRRALETKNISKQLESFETHRQHCFPRYARINTLLTTTKEVCSSLLAEAKKQENSAEEPVLEFYMDPHVPDLLVLPPSILASVMAPGEDDQTKKQEQTTALQRQQQIIKSMIQSGKLILQDKSSCFSALCLARGYDESEQTGAREEMDYMDACAAPGNKTQHLATLVASNSSQSKSTTKKKKSKTLAATATAPTVFAMDRSAERLASLSDRMKQLVPTSDSSPPGVTVSTKEADFLQTEHHDFQTVGAILLDPSCSGSGIYTAPDRWTESTNDGDEDVAKRIDPLANFQEMALNHAMSFPTVFRIVYSTCSLHDRENEIVVMRALSKYNDNEEESEFRWHIVAPKCLGHWKRRGHVVDGLSAEEAECMIRATNKDETNGFFVCCLEKRRAHDPANSSKRSGTKEASHQIVVPKGVTIYDGQFSKKLTEKQTTAAKLAQLAKKTEKPPKKVETSKSSSASGEKRQDKEQKATALEKVASKKRSKKQAWKKRQMEQKQDRLKQKKLKTSTD